MSKRSSFPVDDLLRSCRLLSERGYVVATDGNLSVRNDEGLVLCTPTNMEKAEIREDDLVMVDMHGQVLDGQQAPSTEIRMHLAWYAARPDLRAVIHAHPIHATAFATAGRGMNELVFPEMIVTLGRVPLADYATPSTDEVPLSLAPFLTDYDAILLRNHGVVTAGRDLRSAWHAMERVEHSAHILLLSSLLGGPQTLGPEEISRLDAITLASYGIDPSTRPH